MSKCEVILEKGRSVGEALSHVHAVIDKRDSIHVVHTSEISRKDRESLVGAGWLQEIIKGWYLLVRPDLHPGDSSGWYATFWDFLYVYLTHFYGQNYCLSAEHSLDLHVGMTIVPQQVIVIASKGRGTPLELPFNTSLLIYASKDPLPHERDTIKKLQVMSLPYALCKVSPSFFKSQPLDAEIALRCLTSSAELLRVIVSNNFVRAAGRLVGAYRHLGNTKMVDALIEGLSRSQIPLYETNPFISNKPLVSAFALSSPYAVRIKAMWQQYRPLIIQHFPNPPGLPVDKERYLKQVDEQYVQDAYHSLSIEGYQVTQGLIEKVINAKWNPEMNDSDRSQHNALAARSYFEAFQTVEKSLDRILKGASPGKIIESDLSQWYQKLFGPYVAANIMSQSDLFGYRRNQVYIRNSRHTPPPAHALNDSMEAFFHCLKEETHAGVRAVLGHFVFVFIHPYMDGNGRLGRFLMNVMLGSGGYPWTIVHVEHRKEYLDALEEASCRSNILPFVDFLRSELEHQM